MGKVNELYIYIYIVKYGLLYFKLAILFCTLRVCNCLKNISPTFAFHPYKSVPVIYHKNESELNRWFGILALEVLTIMNVTKNLF